MMKCKNQSVTGRKLSIYAKIPSVCAHIAAFFLQTDQKCSYALGSWEFCKSVPERGSRSGDGYCGVEGKILARRSRNAFDCKRFVWFFGSGAGCLDTVGMHSARKKSLITWFELAASSSDVSLESGDIGSPSSSLLPRSSLVLFDFVQLPLVRKNWNYFLKVQIMQEEW